MTKKILKKRQKKLLKAEVEKIAESLQEGVTERGNCENSGKSSFR